MFYILNVSCVYSLESPHRGNSNEYTQHTVTRKKENLPKLSVYRIWRKPCGLKNLFDSSMVNEPSGVRAIDLFICVEVLRPSQPNVVMSSAVSLPNHTFTGQA